MPTDIYIHDVVAFPRGFAATHCEAARPLTLCRGGVGTVVMTCDDSAVEGELSTEDGCAYAIVPDPSGKVLSLRYRPESEVA